MSCVSHTLMSSPIKPAHSLMYTLCAAFKQYVFPVVTSTLPPPCSDEDDTAELLKELQKIKREREEEQKRKVCVAAHIPLRILYKGIQEHTLG